MDALLDRVIGFFVQNLPSWEGLAIEGPLGLGWSFGALWLAGTLQRKGARTGYTRKVFHFLIFGTVAVLQWRMGTPAVCLFGSACTVAVFFAVWQGRGHLLYEALARPQDEPHRTYFILVPYFTTLIGGLVSNMLFGPVAVAGYLVTGLGDAIGEPAGTMFGRHHYRVRSLSSVPATRSLEGSTAVFVMSVIALLLAAAVSPHIRLAEFGILKVLVIAVVCTLAEAVSPHGWDNATMQVLPTALIWAWMT